MTGLNRRVLANKTLAPPPTTLYKKIIDSPGRAYKITDKTELLQRDRALTTILYLLALRISEAMRLKRSQIMFDENKQAWAVVDIICSKKRTEYVSPKIRPPNYLPCKDERKPLTDLFMEYLDSRSGEKMFPISKRTGQRSVTGITGTPAHWLRAWGEEYLYHHWNKDIIALSKYLNVRVDYLTEYFSSGVDKYGIV